MSKINPGLYSSEDHGWCTPPDLVDAILKFERRSLFRMDVACSTRNIPASYYLMEDGLFFDPQSAAHAARPFGNPAMNGLTAEWHKYSYVDGEPPLCWMNPPYGAKLKLFMKKAYRESEKGCRIWALVPSRTETRYQHDYGLTQAGFTVFLKGRLRFLQNGKDKGTAPFPTMLLYYGSDWQEKADRWVKEQPLPGTLMVRHQAISKLEE